ncbi:MAG: hypothetical protein HC930_01065 [Hydrococcus sp. SU_1_0]|nr:hypothetical protein [Hydrococcus sp. SU_1_0]
MEKNNLSFIHARVLMNFQLNFVADFIKTYCKVLITIYVWSIFGFLRPNLELSSLLLPKSTTHKSILLIIVGTFIFTIFGYCFKLLVTYIVIIILFIRLFIFIENSRLFDAQTDDNMLFLMFIYTTHFILNTFEKEINFFIKICDLMERYDSFKLLTELITKLINLSLIKKLIDRITKKYIVKNSESLYDKQQREIKSAFSDICIALIGFPILLILCRMTVGILLFLFVEYLNIWQLFFPPFFLLFCTNITATQFSD